MILSCPQCMDCEHYELMTCKIHGELKEEAFKNECEDFKEKEESFLKLQVESKTTKNDS